MDISQIGGFIIQALEQFGIAGAILIIFLLLLFKFGDKLVESLTQTLLDGKFETHKRGARKLRKDSIFKINRLLTEIMNKFDGDRIAIFEYHNGGYNLTGLPFLHISLVIQRNKLGVDELSKDLDNIMVSSIPDFINELDKQVIYIIKDISELQTTFPGLYRELAGDGMTQVVFCSLEGVNDQIGFLMLAFKGSVDLPERKILKELIRKTQKISTILDYKNV